MKRRLALCLLALAAWLLVVGRDEAHAGAWVRGSVANAAGARSYQLWVPDRHDVKKKSPLVVMLHGCLQTPEDFAAGARMNEVADAHNFLVAYPEQPATANPYKCWNWFDPAHQSRGAGEPSLIARVVEDVRATRGVDARRTYVVGVSAGGAMASVMAAGYPDLFAGLGVCAGMEYKAAANVAGALQAQQSGGPDPKAQGLQAYEAMTAATATPAKGVNRAARSGRRTPLLRVIVFHGTLDTVVRPVNGEQVVAQWAQANDLLDDARDNDSVDGAADVVTDGSVPGGHHFTRSVYHDAAGKPLLEHWAVRDMKHAWPGGSAAAQYTDPKGPHASEEIWRFFQGTPGTPRGNAAGRRR